MNKQTSIWIGTILGSLLAAGCGTETIKTVTYKQACATSGSNKVRRTTAFVGTEAVTTIETFAGADATCAGSIAGNSTRLYTIVSRTKSDTAGPLDASLNPTLGPSLKTNSITRSSTWTVQNSTVLATFNGGSVCGFSNWVIDVPKDVTGINCTAVATSFLAVGQINYAVKAFVGNNLYLYDLTQKGLTEDGRITTLDPLPYVLQ